MGNVAKTAEAQTIVNSFNLSEHQYIPKIGFYVYAILENGRVCYIGKGQKKRVLQHFTNSSNLTLGTRIKGNRDIYQWVILNCFIEEEECLTFEAHLIKDCKNCNHDLYNTVYYSDSIYCSDNVRAIFNVFNRYENFVYDLFKPHGVLSNSEAVRILFEILQKEISKLSSNRMPTYNGVPLNDLGYYIMPEIHNLKIVERINICHKRDIPSKTLARSA